MMRHSLAFLLLAASCFAACGDDDPPPAGGGGGVVPVGPSGPGSAADGGGGGAVDAGDAATEPTGAALCEGLEQRSQEVAEIALQDATPTPTGGTITPGRYVLNELISYNAAPSGNPNDPPPPPMTGVLSRSTLVISEKNVRFFEGNGTVADGIAADRARASSYVVEGTVIRLTPQCGDANPAPTLPYSVSSRLLTVHLTADRVATYRLDFD